MERFGLTHTRRGEDVLEVPHTGARLLRHPVYNKGTAFTTEERLELGLEGLLPHHVSTMEEQLQRVYANITRKSEPIEKYIGLAALQDRNEHLFYRLLIEHAEEFMPIVYTPTVGQACQDFSHIFRRARGLWITPAHRGRIHQMLGHAPFDDVRLIVVTDNERILGLGDQGAGGMGIPIGKLALYTMAAGIPPWQTLPISLDVGTDNPKLLKDPLYLGWPHARLRGPDYDEFVEEFVQAVKKRFPRAILQWEDFKKVNAFRLLDRYRKALTCFNDDIQGTAAVAHAGIIAAGRVSGTSLARQRIVFLGAGAAGVGIARLVRDAMRRAGLDGADLQRAMIHLDSKGMLVENGECDAHKREFSWPQEMAAAIGLAAGSSLEQVIRAFRPTVLLGTSGEPGAFSEAAIREMARHAPRPAIFPMSNPTSKCEATPDDLVRWSEGRALIATGSPFPPVSVGGRKVRVGQANNAFVFPGLGLGVLVSEAREVTDGLFAAAAERLAELVSPDDLAAGVLYPRVAEIREVTRHVAEAVLSEAVRSGVGRAPRGLSISEAVAAAMWEPRYRPVRRSTAAPLVDAEAELAGRTRG
jgi:malic enzyme